MCLFLNSTWTHQIDIPRETSWEAQKSCHKDHKEMKKKKTYMSMMSLQPPVLHSTISIYEKRLEGNLGTQQGKCREVSTGDALLLKLHFIHNSKAEHSPKVKGLLP